jgi:hypothetical protein
MVYNMIGEVLSGNWNNDPAVENVAAEEKDLDARTRVLPVSSEYTRFIHCYRC